MSVTIDDKRTLTNIYSTGEATAIKTVELPTITDKSTISQSANTLMELPINLQNSTFVEDSGNFSFDFTFNETRYQNISVDGYYSSQERMFSLNLKFIIEKELYEDNKKNTKLYQVDLSITSSNVEIKSLNKKVEKENIYDFLNRILNGITKLLNDNTKNLTGMVFDKEDLKDLMQIGDKEVGKLLNEIFLMLQTISAIKKNKNPNAENVLFAPKRFSEKVIEYTKTESVSSSVQMNINEMDKNS